MGAVGKKRNVVGVWLGLPLITLGIYTYVWWYKINNELRQYDQRIVVNPALSVLAFIPGAALCGVPMFVSIYKTGERIRKAQIAAGLPGTCNPVVGLLLGFVFGLYSLYYQGELNKVWDCYPGAPVGSPVQLAA
ncbi:DUF4234 domain-containing protein [Actinocrinis sp.]|uniref:DUF4234 domain-containing protein n=1 Tax=Actinocrinis sp. TaxID=1920516 RepID=UPI002C8455BC|nr:DUF4234 domain-containing protein [Actinocrinis sp.]HXR70522.1 DUF4234 domain-containing protein [Actinocrinis sp.]